MTSVTPEVIPSRPAGPRSRPVLVMWLGQQIPWQHQKPVNDCLSCCCHTLSRHLWLPSQDVGSWQAACLWSTNRSCWNWISCFAAVTPSLLVQIPAGSGAFPGWFLAYCGRTSRLDVSALQKTTQGWWDSGITSSLFRCNWTVRLWSFSWFLGKWKPCGHFLRNRKSLLPSTTTTSKFQKINKIFAAT